MQELKGLNTTEFYSRFFVETALDKYTEVNAEQVKAIKSIGEKFLLQYHQVEHTSNPEAILESKTWFHREILERLGYQNLKGFFHATNKDKGVAIRGKINLIDEEELWIIEGPFGKTRLDEDPLECTPDESSLSIFEEADFQVDKTSYQKIIRQILAEDNPCAWIIYLCGEKMYLFERGKTLELGAYIEVLWPEVFSNKDHQVFKAVVSLFGYDAFRVVNGDISHHTLAENAHREAHGVTKNLKYGVRDALEILINEALHSHRTQGTSQTLEKLMNEKTSDEVAKILADEGLRYLYRLLFLFFVESRGRDSEILPIKSLGYSLGYSLENIRNLELKRIPGAKNGRYIQLTLERTFSIMFYGVELSSDENSIFTSGFECPRIGTLLFDKTKTPILSEVKLRDLKMKDVISKLSISQMGKGRNKKMARISYANLGLNQLGAVYEGLLSLKPIILADKGLTVIDNDVEFLVPLDMQSKVDKKKLKVDDDGNVVIHEKGEFLFRTMGFERKYSASFYTDEVLTKTLVKECLDEYFLDKNPTLKELKEFKVLEPAMGSGAFLNEAANQLSVIMADCYARENCIPKKMVDGVSVELTRSELVSFSKEYIMRHCLYGVDLNPMASELAKISLWLNCVDKNGSFAFHDFKIRNGNSLIGAWMKVKHKNASHFLSPMPEMLESHIGAQMLGDSTMPFFDEQTTKRLRAIRDEFKAGDKNFEANHKLLQEKIEELYDIHLKKRLELKKKLADATKTTSELEIVFHEYEQQNIEYQKLRSIMDYWCALWFWPASKIGDYPNLEEFNRDVMSILENNTYQNSHVVRELIKSVPFFHYDLEFPEVFSTGGFDLVIGNPPWALLSWSDLDFFSDFNSDYLIKPPKATAQKKLFSSELENKNLIEKYQDSYLVVEGSRNFLSDSKTYPLSDSSKTNTYKYFYQRSLFSSKENGVYGLIKQNGILNDSGTEEMRPQYYQHLKRMYRFVNEKKLFDEIGNLNEYVVVIFKNSKSKITFDLMDNLYHPITIDRSNNASVNDQYPGMKDVEGNFNLNGHPDRIMHVDSNTLKQLTFLEGKKESEFEYVSLPKIHGTLEWKFIQKAITAPKHLGDEEFHWSQMFNETNAPKAGDIIEVNEQHEDISEAVLTGPNIFVGNPYYKFPNPGCKNHRDFSKINLEEISEDYFPATKYRVTQKGKQSIDYSAHESKNYKIIARAYVSQTGSRTLQSAVFPPFVSCIQNLNLFDFGNKINILVSSLYNSIIYDFYSRTVGTNRLNLDFWKKLPFYENKTLEPHLILKALRLNCLSTHYQPLWQECFTAEMKNSPSVEMYAPKLGNRNLSSNWEYDSPVRNTQEREQLLCETDALVAMLMGVGIEDLIKLYRSQFGVLQKNLKDLPGQNEEDSFPREKIMRLSYEMYLAHFGVSEEDVVNGYFMGESKKKVA